MRIINKIAVLLLAAVLLLPGCASTIKPMTIPEYKPPDLSFLKGPIIPEPEEGKDYTIDYQKGTVTYTISGQNKITAMVISEASAWRTIEMIKQIIDIQTQIINQNNQLLIYVDLQRQMEAQRADKSEIKAIVAEILTFIAVGIAIAGAL